MAHYHSRFTGHIEHGDPRGPTTVAGGCKWPTVPAFRLLLDSTNATGLYAPFNTDPVLFQLDLGSATHEYGLWLPTILPDWLYGASIEKLYSRDWFPGYLWHVYVLLTAVGFRELAAVPQKGRCNVDVRIGNRIGAGGRGWVGTGFRARQVEFDQLLPPGE